MRRFFSLAVLCAGLMAQSCAYYNTFYNTKKHFREGLLENKKRVGDKPTSQEVQKFDLAIEKASKILQLYPTSKYADDAVMILGQSFFFKQEYLKAQRKFDELIANFPRSNLAPQARLWLAKTNIELRDYTGAERVLRELQKNPRRGGLNEEAQSLLGEIYFRREMYSLAAQEFEVASKELDDKTLRGRSLMRLGECYQKIGNLQGAVESFRLATSLGGDQDFKFQSSFQFAVALKQEKQYDNALNIFQSLLAEFPTYKDIPLIKVQIADAYHGQGKIDEAKRLYGEIIELHPRTEAAAAAYFYLGDIYERDEKDFVKAQENYDKVRKENLRSDKVNEATRRSKSIGEFAKLKQSIADLETQRQNLKAGEPPAIAATDTANTLRSRRRGGAVKASAATAQPTVESLAGDLAKNKIQMAQLYYFQFDQLDAAIPVYFDVAENFPDSPYAPQALYSLAYIFDNLKNRPATRDSILRVLAQKYPNSPQGKVARRKAGMITDSTSFLGAVPELNDFLVAENLLFDENEPARAIAAHQSFIEKYPLSPYLPKSLYALGWIFENRLGDGRQAYEAYRQLVEKFPDTDFAKDVRAKLAAAEKEFKSSEGKKTIDIASAGSLSALPRPGAAPEDSLDSRQSDRLKADEEAFKNLLEGKERLPMRRPPKKAENLEAKPE